MTKSNRTLESLHAAHVAQAMGIRKHPDFQKTSDEFDVEYEVARQMQDARKLAGLTQAELARRMDTTQSVVSRIESGANVSIETLSRYAEACGNRLHLEMVREPVVEYRKKGR